jgi:hypothetical protein
MSSVTLLDLLKLKSGSDGVLHLADAVGQAAPEVMALPSTTIKGTSYDVTLVTAYPTASFRKANAGVTASGASFETRKAQCFILDTRIEVDKAVARAHDKGPDALMALYSALSFKSALLAVGKQTIYGEATDGSGFPGLSQMVTTGMTVDATGATANAGSSVYFLFGGEFGVQYVYGEGSTFELQPFYDGEGSDAAGKKFPAHISYLNSRPGLSCASPYAVGKIKNLCSATGKGLTDSLCAQLLEKFPTDVFPTAVLMNRARRGELQRSRTVTLQGNGKAGSVGSQDGNIAPIPTEVFGIPIICTDSILNTEAIY